MATRKIMFRGLAENGEWLYGGYVRDRGVDRIFPENYELNGTAVKAGTVGEYSGFSDNKVQ